MDRPLDQKAIGERLRKRVEELGFRTLADLQDALGKTEDGARTSLATISNWLTGKVVPTRHRAKLATVLETTQDWILYGDEATAGDDGEESSEHEAVVTEYLETHRGRTTHYAVAERLLAGKELTQLQRDGHPLTVDDVHDMRKTLERRMNLASPEKPIEADTGLRSGTKTKSSRPASNQRMKSAKSR